MAEWFRLDEKTLKAAIASCIASSGNKLRGKKRVKGEKTSHRGSGDQSLGLQVLTCKNAESGCSYEYTVQEREKGVFMGRKVGEHLPACSDMETIDYPSAIKNAVLDSGGHTAEDSIVMAVELPSWKKGMKRKGAWEEFFTQYVGSEENASKRKKAQRVVDQLMQESGYKFFKCHSLIEAEERELYQVWHATYRYVLRLDEDGGEARLRKSLEDWGESTERDATFTQLEEHLDRFLRGQWEVTKRMMQHERKAVVFVARDITSKENPIIGWIALYKNPEESPLSHLFRPRNEYAVWRVWAYGIQKDRLKDDLALQLCRDMLHLPQYMREGRATKVGVVHLRLASHVGGVTGITACERTGFTSIDDPESVVGMGYKSPSLRQSFKRLYRTLTLSPLSQVMPVVKLITSVRSGQADCLENDEWSELSLQHKKARRTVVDYGPSLSTAQSIETPVTLSNTPTHTPSLSFNGTTHVIPHVVVPPAVSPGAVELGVGQEESALFDERVPLVNEEESLVARWSPLLEPTPSSLTLVDNTVQPVAEVLGVTSDEVEANAEEFGVAFSEEERVLKDWLEEPPLLNLEGKADDLDARDLDASEALMMIKRSAGSHIP